MSDLFNIYGARKSKDGSKLNVTLIRGHEDTKEYATISLKLDDKQSKTKATIREGYAYIKIALLEDKKEEF